MNGARTSPSPTWRRFSRRTTATTARGRPSAYRITGATNRRSRNTTDPSSTAAVSPGRTPSPTTPRVVGSWSSTASSTTATCGSTASTSARPRAICPHSFEVTQPLRERAEHLLAIEVACPPQHDRGAKRTITGGYWQSPVFDRTLNPGGIWRDVRLASTGPVRIDHARAVRRRVGRTRPHRVQRHAGRGRRTARGTSPCRRTRSR